MITELEKLNANIEPLTKTQRRLIGNILTYHGKNKLLAAQRIAEYLKRPLEVKKILGNLNVL